MTRDGWPSHLDASRLESPPLHQPVARAHRQIRKLSRARRDLFRGSEKWVAQVVVWTDWFAADRAEGFEEFGRERLRFVERHLKEELPRGVAEEVRPDARRKERQPLRGERQVDAIFARGDEEFLQAALRCREVVRFVEEDREGLALLDRYPLAPEGRKLERVHEEAPEHVRGRPEVAAREVHEHGLAPLHRGLAG